jgi:drug/metabolite transporter (DMT)-like permease
VLGERSAPGVWLGIGITLLGTMVIAGGDVQSGGTALLGDLMALGAAVAMAGYLVAGRRLRRSMSTVVYAGLVYAVAGVIVAALATASGHSILAFSARDGLIFLALVLIPTLGGHTVFNWALRHLSVSVVGVAIVGEPVVTTLWAWLLLGEIPAATALVGGALTLAGILLALRAGQASPVTTAPTRQAPG